MPQRSSRALAFALVSAYTAAAALVAVVLLEVAAPPAAPASTPAAAPPPAPTPPPSTKPTIPPAQRTPKTFTAVTGPNGIMTVIPNGWQLKPCTTTDYCAQADDPADSGRFLRLGATSAHPESPLVVQTAYEQEFSTGRVNFQRVKLDAVAHRGHDAVDWEFEYDLNGVRRHVKTLLWRAGGEDNWVYASAELTRWPETREIYDRMVDAAKP